MPVKGTFNVTGLNEWMEALVNAGQDVDAAAAEALVETAPYAEKIMHEKLKQSSELWTGETDATIRVGEVQREGNFTYIEVSAGGADAPQAFYKEFGTTRQIAEPFVRPAFTAHLVKNKLKAEMKKIMEKFGLKS